LKKKPKIKGSLILVFFKKKPQNQTITDFDSLKKKEKKLKINESFILVH
jgi:hypothetical protein